MARKKHDSEPHEEHADETWLIPYSDLLTLLLALFIVLFASSTLDKKKMGMMENAFAAAFNYLPADQLNGTIGEFLEIVKPLFGREREKKELAKVFQALRIEVNQEMEALKEMLYAATEALKPGGRLVVITYHSLEDRMVKNIMKTGNVEGKAEKDFFGNVLTPFRLVNNKVIVPDEEEIERNPRSRSAKLRIAERVMND